ncbi:sigma factor-like helix-turn-helix DNA-binding protein [Sorangium sp. So ce296]|uniref:RNA polymerase sigma factor n=1 Tax=Sorangium sp. So ce296 TaxID=3133296 RepID=UPI003F631685
METLPGVFRLLGVAEPDIDDLLQEVLLTAYKTLDRFDPDWQPSQPSWHPPQTEVGVAGDPARRADRAQHRSAEARWVFGIAWRKVGRYLGRARRRRELAHGLVPAWCSEAVDPAPLSEQRAVARERLELVIDLLWTLAPERRLILVLHEAYEVPLAEIARDLGINYNTATSRLRLARADYRAAVQRLRPEQRDALRGCWLGFPLASAFLAREHAGTTAPALPEAAPPGAALPEAAPPAPVLPEEASPEVVPPEVAPPAPALPEAALPDAALPPPAPPALAPPASAPAGLAGWLARLAQVRPALRWTGASAGYALALLLALAPPRPLWADRFGAPLADLLLRARSARAMEVAPRETPAPQPTVPAPDVTSRRAMAPPPARDVAPSPARDVAPPPAPSTSAREDSFVEEYRVLDAAQAMLSAGDPAGALQQLALHEQRFPSGRLRSVRERFRELAQARLAGSAEGAASAEPPR